MQIVLSQPDGIHPPAQALLRELAEDETLYQLSGLFRWRIISRSLSIGVR